MVIKRIKIEVVTDLYLPRFRALNGFKWEVAVHRLEESGFQLGGGFVGNDDFKVVGLVKAKNHVNSNR